MNNKIKAAEVACLIDGHEAYDQIYKSLKDALPSDEEMIFAERSSGYGFLQWELPGDEWTSLDQGDPIFTNEVKRALEQRIQHVKSKFGDNQLMASRILTYPDDSYVFYKTTPEGKLIILLTAWGYRHPEKIGSGPAGGLMDPDKAKEDVSIAFLYGGKPMAEKPFLLNKMSKQTDAEGNFIVGDLPVGYQFDVEVNGMRHHVVVTEGKGKITIDATIYTCVAVDVTLDGKPCPKAEVNINYFGQQLRLETDMEGKTTAQLPLGDENQQCVVSVGSETQSKPLVGEQTHFAFDLVSPEEPVVEPPVEPSPVEELPVEEPPVQEPEPPAEPEVEEVPTEKEGNGCASPLLLGLAIGLLVVITFCLGWLLL